MMNAAKIYSFVLDDNNDNVQHCETGISSSYRPPATSNVIRMHANAHNDDYDDYYENNSNCVEKKKTWSISQSLLFSQNN